MGDHDDDPVARFDELTKANHARIAQLLLLVDIPIELPAVDCVVSEEGIDALINARTLLYLLPMRSIHREAVSTAILDFLGGLVHAGLSITDPGDHGWLMENATVTMLRVHEEIAMARRLLTGRVSDEELEPG
ncbi:hypothetical protein F3087_11060 [Nocardia colli]|uniref:Uncharacterized protein n=1 Tax=Nocardia colli TaxID=2545717 RepID=A0A5N0EKP9_9NOCA|nr:hypothetical protein [Nocardia colli]KAA8889456.1 hypothetical protein F3087_11060 [Nocardia colli]